MMDGKTELRKAGPEDHSRCIKRRTNGCMYFERMSRQDILNAIERFVFTLSKFDSVENRNHMIFSCFCGSGASASDQTTKGGNTRIRVLSHIEQRIGQKLPVQPQVVQTLSASRIGMCYQGSSVHLRTSPTRNLVHVHQCTCVELAFASERSARSPDSIQIDSSLCHCLIGRCCVDCDGFIEICIIGATH